MTFRAFHHPDISIPIIKRRAADEFFHLVLSMGDTLTTRGKSVLWNSCFPSNSAHWSAVSRLRKAGLIITEPSTSGSRPIIELTESARNKKPALATPHRLWKRKWKGYWYILMYDVPEKERAYRDTLRAFLARLSMGCLQKSIWISPDDIRPQYDDLKKAAAVDDHSFMFESRSVLERDPADIVMSAWPFEMLERLHQHYLNTYQHNLKQLRSRSVQTNEIIKMIREESAAHFSVMSSDPLLPSELLPADYLGMKVHDLHTEWVKEIAARL